MILLLQNEKNESVREKRSGRLAPTYTWHGSSQGGGLQVFLLSSLYWFVFSNFFNNDYAFFYKKKVIFNIQKDDRNKYRDSTIMSKKKKKERKNYIGKSDSKSANILVSGPRLSLRSSSDKDRARGEIMGKLVMFLELRDNYADTL